MIMLAAMVLYQYSFKLHMNGRLLDVYHRLHCGEGRFVVPLDMEVSARELRRIIDETRRWRGMGGGSRRIIVLYYALVRVLSILFTFSRVCRMVLTCGSTAVRRLSGP
jgi:hypothetical protein